MRRDRVLLCMLVLTAGCFSLTDEDQPSTGGAGAVSAPVAQETVQSGGEETAATSGARPAAGAPSDLSATKTAGTTFTISGVVTYGGPQPERRAVQMGRDPDPECAAIHGTEPLLDEDTLVSSSGRVKNVFLYVKDVKKGEFPTPDRPAVLDQSGCMYRPRVQGVRVGQTLRIVNSDSFTHNVYSFARRNRAFNIGQPGQGTREKVFRRPEPAIKIKCDIHPWMTAYLFIMDHPFFAVSDESGSFAISGLPAGKHTLVAWHEKLGEQETQIAVTSKVTNVNFEFQALKE